MTILKIALRKKNRLKPGRQQQNENFGNLNTFLGLTHHSLHQWIGSHLELSQVSFLNRCVLQMLSVIVWSSKTC